MANETYLGDNSPSGVIISAQSGVKIANATSEKVAFYGTTAISQRASSWQATSVIGTASSTDVTTDLKATVIEIMNTLNNIGVWKGSA